MMTHQNYSYFASVCEVMQVIHLTPCLRLNSCELLGMEAHLLEWVNFFCMVLSLVLVPSLYVSLTVNCDFLS